MIKALPHAFGHFVQNRAHVGVPLRDFLVEHVENAAELRGTGARRNMLPNLAVEEEQAHRVVLPQQHVR